MQPAHGVFCELDYEADITENVSDSIWCISIEFHLGIIIGWDLDSGDTSNIIHRAVITNTILRLRGSNNAVKELGLVVSNYVCARGPLTGKRIWCFLAVGLDCRVL